MCHYIMSKGQGKGSKVKGQKGGKTDFPGHFWVQKLSMGLIRTREDQVGNFWQRANYVWHLAKCCRTTGCFLWKYLPVLASCQSVWQGAKFGKSPRPKHCAIARCEVYLSIYIAYNSVSIPTPWAVAGPHGQLAST